MPNITVYSIRPDGVYGGETVLEVRDALKSPIPKGFTKQSPEPIPANHYAVMQGGWKYIQGTAPVYQSPSDTVENVANFIRQERDKNLIESDWTQVLDAAVDQAAWATYRQALRDIPQQEGFPATVVWPTQPE
jgi:hypothetical protein